MKGTIRTKAGRYDLGDGVSMAIRLNDDGVVLAVTDSTAVSAYSGTIDEYGKVVRATVRRKSTANKAPRRVRLAPMAVETADDKRSGGSSRHRRIRFTLKYGGRLSNRPFALGAYTNGTDVHVLYRVQGGSRSWDGHMHIADRVLIGGQVAGEDCLPKDRWMEFLSWPSNSRFRLTHSWRKMTMPEVRELLNERTLYVHSETKHRHR